MNLTDEFSAALDRYMEQIKQSYIDNCNGIIEHPHQFRFVENIYASYGKKYIKVVGDRSVHSFVVAVETDAKFAYGDILKAGSWKTPERNHARGNIFADDNEVHWTGAPYMQRQ